MTIDKKDAIIVNITDDMWHGLHFDPMWLQARTMHGSTSSTELHIGRAWEHQAPKVDTEYA